MIARNNLPLHLQVKDDLLSKIKDTTYKQGERIPSERALSERYGVSRVTIRNTINELVHLGVLYRRHGSGTYVKEVSIESQMIRMISGVEQLEKLGMKVDIELLSAEYIKYDEHVSEALELKSEDRVYRIIRRIFANEEPLLVSYVHTPAEVGRKLENINMNKAAFLATLEDFGYQIQYAKEKIRAVRASQFEVDQLRISADTPLLCIERRVFVSGDKPIYTTRDMINGDRYVLNTQLQRNI